MGTVHVCLLFNSEYPFAKHYDMDTDMDETVWYIVGLGMHWQLILLHAFVQTHLFKIGSHSSAVWSIQLILAS